MNIARPDDERFAEFLRDALENVHTPVPAPPRDEIWAAISAQRHGGSSPTVSARVSASVVIPQTIAARVVSVTPRKIWSVPMRWALPIAAAFLVVGVGVGLQFEKNRTSQDAAALEAARLPAEMPTQVAAEQHFSEVNKLLATFASHQNSDATAVNNAAVEAEIGIWARNLLGTTQLLLDSPIGMDPQRRKLLTDVELVLVQIAQLAPNASPDDRELTERSIEQSQVMERLQHESPNQNSSDNGTSQGPHGI